MADETPSHDTPITRKERILELANIEKDVTSSLLSASSAIRSLTSQATAASASPDAQPDMKHLTPEQARQAFEQHTNAYMSHIQAVSARLKRQIYALEEAGIIPATAKDEETPMPQTNAARRTAPTVSGLMTTAPPKDDALAPITNGGLGRFDVGWLNSRRDDVGKQKEAELWAEARSHLERMQHSQDKDSMDVD